MGLTLPQNAGGDGQAINSTPSPCVDFEVEFLNCKTMDDVNNSEAWIKAIPEGDSLSSVLDLILEEQGRHYVNLPHEEKWVDQGISAIDRTTRFPRVVIRFKKKPANSKTIRLTIIDPSTVTNSGYVGDNLKYSESELGRNENFKDNLGPIDFTIPPTGYIIINQFPSDFNISALGGNKYQLKAEEIINGNPASPPKFSTGIIEIWRYFWLQAMEYSKLTNHITYSEIAEHYVSSFIEINTTRHEVIRSDKLGVEEKFDNSAGRHDRCMPEIKNIYTSKCTGSLTEPYTIILACLLLCSANVKCNTYFEDITIYKDDFYVRFNPPIISYNGFRDHDEWLDSITFTYIDINGIKHSNTPLDKSACIAIFDSNQLITYVVKMSRSRFPSQIPNGTRGIITLRFKTAISTTLGGWYGKQFNICVVAMEQLSDRNDFYGMKSRNLKPSFSKSGILIDPGTLSIAIHEIGHYMHMVTDGFDGKPDDRGNYQETSGGPHCSNNLPGVGVVLSPPCVMYWAGGIDSFCSDCVIELRKMDLSKGNKSFIIDKEM